MLLFCSCCCCSCNFCCYLDELSGSTRGRESSCWIMKPSGSTKLTASCYWILKHLEVFLLFYSCVNILPCNWWINTFGEKSLVSIKFMENLFPSTREFRNPWTYSCCFSFFAQPASFLWVEDVFMFLLHSKFCMDMNSANPFIYYYDISVVALP